MTQIKYLLTRTIRGYIFIIPMLIVYFVVLFAFRKKQKILHIAAVFVFSFYLCAIISATGIGCTALSSFTPEVMLVPFWDVFNAPVHFILNTIAFMPCGLLLPLLYKKFNNIKIIAITGFLFSLCIELVQMFGWGVTEIDDLMANTFGTCLGYYIFVWTKDLHKSFGKKLRAANINDSVEVLLLSVCVFAVMSIIQPAVIL